MIPATKENIRSALTYLSPDIEHKEWFKIAASIKSALGVDGFELFDEWSSQGQNYDKSATLATWKGSREVSSISIGTVFGLALERGWKPDGDDYHETEQERQQREADRKAKEAKAEKDRLKKARDAVKKTQALLSVAKIGVFNPNHPYLLKKGVKALGLTEIQDTDAAKILGYTPKSNNEPLTGRLLIAPVSVDGQLSTAELIDENGKKAAIAGGIKAAGYWTYQTLPADDRADLIIAIAEGVATTLSIAEATGYLSIAEMLKTF